MDLMILSLPFLVQTMDILFPSFLYFLNLLFVLFCGHFYVTFSLLFQFIYLLKFFLVLDSQIFIFFSESPNLLLQFHNIILQTFKFLAIIFYFLCQSILSIRMLFFLVIFHEHYSIYLNFFIPNHFLPQFFHLVLLGSF